jgi:hypothetical protein
MGGIVLGIVILAVAICGAILLWRLSTRAVTSGRWALIVVCAGILGFVARPRSATSCCSAGHITERSTAALASR